MFVSGSQVRRNDTTLIALPSRVEEPAHVLCVVQLLDRFELVIALRVALVGLFCTPSVSTGIPPAASIFMAIDVPERGSPETTTIGWP